MLNTVTNLLIKVDSDDVIAYAQDEQLEISEVSDFRGLSDKYDRIEHLMEGYRHSHARSNALSGLTTGIGGFTTALTFAGIDTALTALHLYRLAQKYAILNGFDPEDALGKDKIFSIYFEALGINAVAQATLKHQILKAGSLAATKEAGESLLLRLIAQIGRLTGRNMSAKNAGKFVPVVGGLIGASVNYTFAKKASHSLMEAFREAYFDHWG